MKRHRGVLPLRATAAITITRPPIDFAASFGTLIFVAKPNDNSVPYKPMFLAKVAMPGGLQISGLTVPDVITAMAECLEYYLDRHQYDLAQMQRLYGICYTTATRYKNAKEATALYTHYERTHQVIEHGIVWQV